MKKEKNLLVLWIIFGFLFITAIDSILYFVLHMILFGLTELEISVKILKLVIPTITLTLYGLTTYILIKWISQKSNTSKIYLSNFPKKLIVLTAIVAFTLAPITNLLAGIYSGHVGIIENFDAREYLDFFYDWFQNSLTISRWAVIIVLLFVFIAKLKSLNKSQASQN